jgi:hypothetical protein
LSSTPIKRYSVFVTVDKDESTEVSLTDGGDNVLYDGITPSGSIDYDSGAMVIDT